MIPRGADRRKGRARFCEAMADRRRAQFERRGTVPAKLAPTRQVKLYGERRQQQKE